MKSKVLIVLLLLFTISTATAEEFVSFGSGICQFNLRDYELAPHIKRAIVFGISRILDTYKDTFGFSYPDDFRVKVTIFGDKEEFKKYGMKQGGSSVWGTGYYSPLYREVVVWKNEDDKKMIAILFHEASHLVLMHQVPKCPAWVNEGLSEYFAGLNVMGENRRVYLQKSRSKWCKYWLKNGFPIELDKYISLSQDEWRNFRKRDSNAAYTIGYSLVYFMMSRKSTERVLKALLWEFKRQGKQADVIQIINNCYPGGFEKLERQWRKWIPRARAYRPLRALRKQAENKPESSAK